MAGSLVVFDLDGTLLNSLTDLAGAANAALADLGAPPHPVDAYREFIGDGMLRLAERALPPARRHEADAMLAALLAHYEQRWHWTTRPYYGVIDLLLALARRAVPCAVLTNKPQRLAQQVVAALLPEVRFQRVLGVQPGVPPKPDPAGARRLLAEFAVAPAQCLLVGDSGADMRAARGAGMVAVGAAWGFRAVEELGASGAHHVICHPDDVLALLPRPRQPRRDHPRAPAPHSWRGSDRSDSWSRPIGVDAAA
jgi:phosphoglycolate phosphatase